MGHHGVWGAPRRCKGVRGCYRGVRGESGV